MHELFMEARLLSNSEYEHAHFKINKIINLTFDTTHNRPNNLPIVSNSEAMSLVSLLSIEHIKLQVQKCVPNTQVPSDHIREAFKVNRSVHFACLSHRKNDIQSSCRI